MARIYFDDDRRQGRHFEIETEFGIVSGLYYPDDMEIENLAFDFHHPDIFEAVTKEYLEQGQNR